MVCASVRERERERDVQNIMRSASAETLPQQQLLDSQVSVCVCVCGGREGGCGVC